MEPSTVQWCNAQKSRPVECVRGRAGRMSNLSHRSQLCDVYHMDLTGIRAYTFRKVTMYSFPLIAESERNSTKIQKLYLKNESCKFLFVLHSFVYKNIFATLRLFSNTYQPLPGTF